MASALIGAPPPPSRRHLVRSLLRVAGRQFRCGDKERESKMKRYGFSALALCLIAACGSGGAGSSGGSTTTSSMNSPAIPSVPTNTSFEGMLNGVRAANGAGPVTFDARLGAAAQVHANDMLSNNFFDHQGSDGSNVGQRVRRQNYNYRAVAENIAKGYQTEESVMNGWTNSPGHHRNNINPVYEDFGLARAGSGSNRYWVLVLGSEL